jgi:hypothetical protein
MKKRFLISLFICGLSTASLLAQVNFSGTWALNESKSDFGGSQFRLAGTTLVVTQDEKVLTVESTMPGRDGNEFKSTAKYNLDGTPAENPMFNSTQKSTLTWAADKSSFTIASTMTFEMNGESRTMNSKQTWKKGDGGILQIESVRTGREGNEIKTIAAYDKK